MRRLVDHEALDLVEHRRVRRVAVAAVDAARRDDADRRLLRHHGADLHRARVRAQHQPRAVGLRREIEGVVLLPRGVLGRDVELGEVEVVGLDVRPFGDGEAHVGEDLDDLVEHLADGMDAAAGERAEPHGQRDVGLLGLRAGRRARASSAALRASSASLTRALRSLTACPKPLRSSGGSEPSVAISSGMRPFLPSAAMRTRSMAARSPAPAISARSSLSSVESSGLEPVMTMAASLYVSSSGLSRGSISRLAPKQPCVAQLQPRAEPVHGGSSGRARG